jgi:hypothetical protein
VSEDLAFTLFAVVVGGVLGVITVGMVAVVVLLIRWNRRRDRC